MSLFAERVGLIDTENAFKIGPYIRQLEEQGKPVIRCNLGEPDFPHPAAHQGRGEAAARPRQHALLRPPGHPPAAEGDRAQIKRDARDPGHARTRWWFSRAPSRRSASARRPTATPATRSSTRAPASRSTSRSSRYLGAMPVPLHLDEAHASPFTAANSAAVITDRTKLIYLNFPSNPTGGVATREQLKDIAEIIRKCCRRTSASTPTRSTKTSSSTAASITASPRAPDGRTDHPRQRRLQEFRLDRRPDRLCRLPHQGRGRHSSRI